MLVCYKKKIARVLSMWYHLSDVSPLSIHYIICNVFIIDAGYNKFINVHSRYGNVIV